MTTRIVFLIPDLESAGDLTPLRTLLSNLEQDQYDLRVLTFSKKVPPAAEGVSQPDNWTTIMRRTPADLVAWWQFRKYLQRLAPHIIHLWQPLDFAWTTLLADLLHRGNLVISLADPAARIIQHPNLATQFIYKRPYQFITTTCYLQHQLLQLGIGPEQCALIPAAVPACQLEGGKSQVRADFSIPPESRLIGSLNQMRDWKQIQDLIWVTAVLKVATDDIHLIMNGHGLQRQRLQRFAEQAEIQDHVHWIDQQQTANQWLPAVDCYVSTTRHVGHSTGILHGMSAGLPIAAFDCPGNRELFISGEQGLLTPAGDCGSLARAVWKLLGDPKLARQLGKQGHERVQQLFTTDKMVESHHTLYQSVPIH